MQKDEEEDMIFQKNKSKQHYREKHGDFLSFGFSIF